MGMRANFIIEESISELNKLHKTETNYQLKLKLKCLIFTKEKKYSTQHILATNLGVSYTTIKRWLKQYREESLLSYLSIKRGGNRKSVIDSSLHQALSDRVNSSTEPFKGYWDVRDWVLEKFDIDIKYTTIRSYLIRHFKTKLKTPRKSHYKKDEQAIEAFLKTP